MQWHEPFFFVDKFSQNWIIIKSYSSNVFFVMDPWSCFLNSSTFYKYNSSGKWEGQQFHTIFARWRRSNEFNLLQGRPECDFRVGAQFLYIEFCLVFLCVVTTCRKWIFKYNNAQTRKSRVIWIHSSSQLFSDIVLFQFKIRWSFDFKF